jgi:hypothetical protein
MNNNSILTSTLIESEHLNSSSTRFEQTYSCISANIDPNNNNHYNSNKNFNNKYQREEDSSEKIISKKAINLSNVTTDQQQNL